MIVSVGDIAIDDYSTGEKHVGGIATNFAVHVHRLGEAVTLISAVGNDANGQRALERMATEGLNVDHIYQLNGETARQCIEFEGTERVFCGFSVGVFPEFRLSPEDVAAMRTAAAVVIPLTDGLHEAFDQAMHADLNGALKVVDFSRDADIPGFEHGDVIAMLQKYILNIDIAFVGGDESLMENVSALAKKYPEKILILTLGSQGSVAFHGNEYYEQKAIWIENLVDTTGCGDAFRAAFMVSYLCDKNVAAALQAGAELAAKTASHMGAF